MYTPFLQELNFLKLLLTLISNIHPKKKIENEYISTSLKDIYKKYSKPFQDPTRDLLDPMVEFVCWYPYFELEPLKSLHNEMKEQSCIIRILIYISSIP